MRSYEWLHKLFQSAGPKPRYRRRRRSAWSADSLVPRLSIKRLEERCVLNADAAPVEVLLVDAGAEADDGTADTFQVEQDAQSVRVLVNGREAYSGYNNSAAIRIVGSSDNDVLVADLLAGAELTFDGGGGHDALQLHGGSDYDSVHYDLGGIGGERIEATAAGETTRVTLHSVERVADTLNAAERGFTLIDGGQQATLSAAEAEAQSQLTVAHDGHAAIEIAFSNPSDALHIKTNAEGEVSESDGWDHVELASLGAGFSADLFITGDAGDALASGGDLDLAGGDLYVSTGSITFSHTLASEGATFDLHASQSIELGGESNLDNPGGSVKLDSGDFGTTTAAGRIDVSHSDNGPTGGVVHLLGGTVGLLDRAEIDASGQSGGGVILIGGALAGADPLIRNAQHTVVEAGAKVRADAITTGSGGRIIIWADLTTRVDGALSARGGAESGDGGFIETSGRQDLDFGGTVDATAANGAAGTWLIDPTDITIGAANAMSLELPDTPIPGTNTFVGDLTNPLAATIDAADIITALEMGINVIVTTVSGGVGPVNGGQIVVAADITPDLTMVGGANTVSLMLLANTDIIVNAGVTIGASAADPGDLFNLDFQADSDSNASGAVTINGAIDLSTGGSLSISAQDFDLLGTINASTGAVTITDAVGTGIGLGDTPIAGGLNITGAELQQITATGMTLNTAGNITVNNITSANSNNITGVTTLNATGATSEINFGPQDVDFHAFAANATSGISFNGASDLETDVGGVTLNADSDGAGGGDLTVTANASIVTNGQLLTITANDIILADVLNSGAAEVIINDSDGGGIGLGDTAIAGGLNLTGAELELISATGLTLNTAGNIVVDNISADNSNNIAGVTTLNATGAASTITFQTGDSTFNALAANSTSGITVAANVALATDVGGITLDADSNDAGGGDLTVAAGASVVTGDQPLTITASDLLLTGTLNSGAAATVINDSDGGGIGLGGTAIAGGLNITGAELELITATGLTLETAGNIIVNGISADNSDNIAGTTTLNATGPASIISFQTAASTFNALAASAVNGLAVNVDLTTDTGSLTLEGDSNNLDDAGTDQITFAAGVTLDSAGDLTLDATSGGLAAAGALTMNIADDVALNDNLNVTGLLTITNTDGDDIALGAAAGGLTLTGAELQRITSAGLTLNTAGNITVNGVTAPQSNNITGTVTLNATGAASTVTFDTANSTFNALAANATSGITVAANVALATDVGGITLDADSNDAGGGDLTVAAGASVVTGDQPLTITASDLLLTGTLNSGAAATVINDSDGGGIGLGGTAIAGGLNITGAELVQITATGLTLNTAGLLRVNGVSAANSDNIAGTTTLNATGPGSTIVFQAAASTFNALAANATNGVGVNVDVTTDTGALALDGDSNNANNGPIASTDDISFTAGRVLTSATSITLDATTGGMTAAGALTLNAADDVAINDPLNVTGLLTINNTDGDGIGLGDAVAAGGLNLSGAALQNITAAGLTLNTAGNITVDNVTAANSNNIAGVTTLNATGAASTITFQTTASTFNALAANAVAGIAVNVGLSSDVAGISLDADTGDAGTGDLTVAAAATVTTNGQALGITANDLILDGMLNSGAGATTITDSDGTGIGFGGTAIANGLNLVDLELSRVTATGLTLSTAGNIIVDGITAASSNGVAGVTTLNASGAASTVSFDNNGSTFNALAANATEGIAFNASLTTDVGGVTLNADTDGMNLGAITDTAGDDTTVDIIIAPPVGDPAVLTILGATTIGASADNALNLSVGSLIVNSSNGDAFFTETDTQNDDIDLGTVNVSADDNLFLRAITGSITDANNDSSVIANDLTLTTDELNAAIGATGAAADINVMLAGAVTATATSGAGGVFLGTNGDLRVNQISAGAGAAGGNVELRGTQALANPTAMDGSILTVADDGTADVIGRVITISRVGAIGEMAASLDVTANDQLNTNSADDQFIDGIGNLPLGILSAGTGTSDITLDASMAITDAQVGEGMANSNLVASAVSLTAVMGIGDAADDINTNIATLEATNTTDGAIFIEEVSGLTVVGTGVRTLDDDADDLANTDEGDITLDVNAGDLTTMAVVSAAADGDVTLNADLGDVGLNAAVSSTTGNIGVTGQVNVTQAAGGDISTGDGAGGTGDVAVTSTTGDITMSDGAETTAGMGLINYTAMSGGVALGRLANNAMLEVTAMAGAITDNTAAEGANLVGAAAALRASAGIGTMAADIDSTLANVEGTGGTGGAFLQNTAVLAIGGVDAGLIGLSADGEVSVATTAGNLTVAEAVASNMASATLDAGSTLQVNDTVTGFQDVNGMAVDDINIMAAVTATNQSVTLGAGDDLQVDALVTGSQNVTGTAVGDINTTAMIMATNQSVMLDAGENAVLGGQVMGGMNVNATAGVDLTTNALVQAVAQSVTVGAGNNAVLGGQVLGGMNVAANAGVDLTTNALVQAVSQSVTLGAGNNALLNGNVTAGTTVSVSADAANAPMAMNPALARLQALQLGPLATVTSSLASVTQRILNLQISASGPRFEALDLSMIPAPQNLTTGSLGTITITLNDTPLGNNIPIQIDWRESNGNVSEAGPFVQDTADRPELLLDQIVEGTVPTNPMLATAFSHIYISNPDGATSDFIFVPVRITVLPGILFEIAGEDVISIIQEPGTLGGNLNPALNFQGIGGVTAQAGIVTIVALDVLEFLIVIPDILSEPLPTAPPVEPPAIAPTTPAPLVSTPLTEAPTSTTPGATTQAEERYYELRIVSFDQDGKLVETPEERINLSDERLKAIAPFNPSRLPDLFQRLPGDRYRIYLIEDGTERLMIEFVIEQVGDEGRPIELPERIEVDPQAGFAPEEEELPERNSSPVLDSVTSLPPLDAAPPRAGSLAEQLGKASFVSTGGLVFGAAMMSQQARRRREQQADNRMARFRCRRRRPSRGESPNERPHTSNSWS